MFGFFPFTWTNYSSKRLKSHPSSDHSPFLKKSAYLSFWSFLISTLICLIMTCDIFYAITEPRCNVNCTSTHTYAHAAYEVFNAVGVILLQVMGYWHSWKLRELIEYSIQLSHLKEIHLLPLKKSFRTIFLITSVVVFNTLRCASVLYYESQVLQPWSQFLVICRYFLQTFYRGLLLIIFQIYTEFAAACLKMLFQPIQKTAIRKVLCHEMMKSEEEINVTSQIIEVTPSWSKQGAIYRVPTTTSLQKQSSPEKSVIDDSKTHKFVTELDEVNFDSIKLMILGIFDYLNLVVEYLGPFLFVLMSVLVMSLLVSIFYLSLFLQLNSLYKVLTTLHLMITILPLFYAANIPTCFESVVCVPYYMSAI